MKTTSWKDAWNEGPGPITKKDFLILWMKGFIMGIADLIPGVSGGTIAFITGIYGTLLDAIASVDKEFLGHLLKLDLKSATSKIHIRFLIPLLFGVVCSILGLARVMHYLMNEQAIPTWAMFFGLIAASIIVIWKQLEKRFSPINLLFISVGAVFAWILVSVIPVDTPDSLWFIFLCGFIAITAMILPGISGSFLLLILGKYEYITGALKNPFAEGSISLIVVFIIGAVTGLLGFSKILNHLMKNHHEKTMAFLTGILIGSMKKVWPWKEVLESKIIRGKLKILRDTNIMPSSLSNETILALSLIVIGFVIVLVLESKTRKA